MNQEQLSALLGVSLETVKAWRSVRYKDSPLRLVPSKTYPSSAYSNEDIVEWLLRNPSYKSRVLALLPVPEPALTPAPMPAPAGLFALHTHQPTPETTAP